MTAIKNAISQLASDRATVGANEEQLSYTSSQLSTLNNNLSAAKSNITDVDVAQESTNYAKREHPRAIRHRHARPGQQPAAIHPEAARLILAQAVFDREARPSRRPFPASRGLRPAGTCNVRFSSNKIAKTPIKSRIIRFNPPQFFTTLSPFSLTVSLTVPVRFSSGGFQRSRPLARVRAGVKPAAWRLNRQRFSRAICKFNLHPAT